MERERIRRQILFWNINKFTGAKVKSICKANAMPSEEIRKSLCTEHLIRGQIS
jgi:hypothetical protein